LNEQGSYIVLREETHRATLIPTGYIHRVMYKDTDFGFPVDIQLETELLRKMKDWCIVEETIQDLSYPIIKKNKTEVFITKYRLLLWFYSEENAVLYKLAMNIDN